MIKNELISQDDNKMAYCETIYKKEIVFLIDEEIFDEILFDKILSRINKNYPDKKIGFDMKKVKSITSKKFIKYLLLNKFKLFNLKSEVLAYLGIILKDGFLKSYMNFSDFKEEKRELIRRKLYVA